MFKGLDLGTYDLVLGLECPGLDLGTFDLVLDLECLGLDLGTYDNCPWPRMSRPWPRDLRQLSLSSNVQDLALTFRFWPRLHYWNFKTANKFYYFKLIFNILNSFNTLCIACANCNF